MPPKRLRSVSEILEAIRQERQPVAGVLHRSQPLQYDTAIASVPGEVSHSAHSSLSDFPKIEQGDLPPGDYAIVRRDLMQHQGLLRVPVVGEPVVVPSEPTAQTSLTSAQQHPRGHRRTPSLPMGPGSVPIVSSNVQEGSSSGHGRHASFSGPLYSFPPAPKQLADLYIDETGRVISSVRGVWTVVQDMEVRFNAIPLYEPRHEAIDRFIDLFPISAFDNLIFDLKESAKAVERLRSRKTAILRGRERPHKRQRTGVESIMDIRVRQLTPSASASLEVSKQPQFNVHTLQQCIQCGETTTPEWRKGPSGTKELCNACGLYYSKLVKRYGAIQAGLKLEEKKALGNPDDRRI